MSCHANNYDFQELCGRIIRFERTCISDMYGDVHNKKRAWVIFLEHEKERYLESGDGPQKDSPPFEIIEYNFVAPWLTRYENASEDHKESIIMGFTNAMRERYYSKLFPSL